MQTMHKNYKTKDHYYPKWFLDQVMQKETEMSLSQFYQAFIDSLTSYYFIDVKPKVNKRMEVNTKLKHKRKKQNK